MAAVVGDLLPLAVGIAISPVPIIAVILMLLSPNAKSSSVGFMAGWVLGIAVAVTAFTVLSAVLPGQGSGGGSAVVGVIKTVLGALLLLLALKQFRGRPREGQRAELPTWMVALDSMTPARTMGLGFLLAAVNPKNLLLAISAGLITGEAGLTQGAAVAVIVIFVVLAASTVLIPVLGYLLASARMAGPLDRLRAWLVENNAVIMAVLLLVIGATMVGKGIGSL